VVKISFLYNHTNVIMKNNPATVLVIEKHPMMHDALCAAIAEESDLSVTSPDASLPAFLTLALKDETLFLPSKPDIILLSIGSPARGDMDTLAALIRALPGVPILALVTNESPDQVQAALANGAQAVLAKSAPRAELLRALRSICSLKVSQS
jgi:DNA-binding NarL/FixJ family response regulator